MTAILSVGKSLDILEEVARAEDGIGTRELSRQLGLNVTSVHNIAATLAHRGFLEQDPETRVFRLGIRLMLLGQHRRTLDRLKRAARPIMERLLAELDESVMLTALDGGQVACLLHLPSSQALRIHEPEDLFPLAHCTASGKVMLAAMTDEDLSTCLDTTTLTRFTKQTLVSREALLEELTRVREQGLARTENELSEGVSALAVPVQNPWGRTVAALGASAPTVRFDQPQQERTLKKLQAASGQIAEAWVKRS